MGKNVEEIKEIKGFLPRAIKFAGEMDESFAEGLAGFYKSVWTERKAGLSMKEKHLLVFTVACSNNNTESAAKILERLKKFGANRTEVTEAMMVAAWTGGIQNFTDFSKVLLKEMEKLGF